MGNFFAKNIKFLRENSGLSKSEYSKKINVSQSTLSRWENEDMGITLDNLYDVAEILNISIADLSGVDLSKNDNFKNTQFLLHKYNKLDPNDKEMISNIIETRYEQLDDENKE